MVGNMGIMCHPRPFTLPSDSSHMACVVRSLDIKSLDKHLVRPRNRRLQIKPWRHSVTGIPFQKWGYMKKNELCLHYMFSQGVINSEPNKHLKVKMDKALNQNISGDEVGLRQLEPNGGKSGSVSFCGLTYNAIEEQKMVSSTLQKNIGPFVWFIGPTTLIVSLVLPQFFLNNFILAFTSNEIIADIIYLISSELLFYIGLATFLAMSDYVRRPHLIYNDKRWSLISGLRGCLHSSIITMGLKTSLPLLAMYVVWPVVGLPAVVAMAPFLLGCIVQPAFESFLNKAGSSSWPLVPIIFEVYRLYQLSRAAQFIERLIIFARRSAGSPDLLDKGNSLMSILVVLQLLGVVCLWSLATFLLRLFPSRPTIEKV